MHSIDYSAIGLADGPDEVHRNAIAKLEPAKHMPPAERKNQSNGR
ncbi:MAG: hypothetical protein ABIO64_02580 [Burkholderiaceae bacterium]